MSPGPSRVVQALAVLLLAVLAPACGGKGGGGSKKPTGISSVLLTTPVGVQKGAVSVGYTLADPGGLTCTIGVEYSVNGGGVWQPATMATGGDGTSDLASSAGGVSHVYKWNSVVDGVALGSADTNIRIRITPASVVPGTPAATTNFTVDNTGNTAPSVAVTTPVVPSGLIPVSYSLTDAQSDLCSLQPSFSIDGGSNFSPATPGPGGDGVANLAASPGGGTLHTFLWNSVADGVALGGANAAVKIRLLPSDGVSGAAGTTSNFSVDNSGKSSGSSLGGYPIQVNGSAVSDWATCVATDGTALYVLGFENFDFESSSGANSSWKLRKILIETGASVGGFGAGGIVSGNPGSGLDIPFKGVVSGGYLYLVMARESGAGSRSFELRIEKRNAVSGALVTGFGSGGRSTRPRRRPSTGFLCRGPSASTGRSCTSPVLRKCRPRTASGASKSGTRRPDSWSPASASTDGSTRIRPRRPTAASAS
jgi:hypothetical protein